MADIPTRSDGPDIQMDGPSEQTLSATQPQLAASGSRPKRKRASSDTSNRSSRAKKSRTTERSKKHKKPKRPSDWHLSKDEIPKEAKETKLALELHVRILWGLPDQNTVPPVVTDDMKLLFRRRFSSRAQVKRTVTTSLDEHANNVDDARIRVERLLRSLPENGIISNNIRHMEESDLLFMFGTVACAELGRWAPDVLSRNPTSLYNGLHEEIALKTFRQVSTNFGYSHVGNNLSFAENNRFIRKLYRNFVHAYMHDIARLEQKKPQSVAKLKSNTNVYKHRSKLAHSRVDVLKAEGFNALVVALAEETEAHSDDEFDSESGSYLITQKYGRSTKVTDFFRMADIKHQRMARSKRGSPHRTERHRKEPEVPRKSKFQALPSKVPIDWFSPTYWNNDLTLRERANIIAENGVKVALPLAEHCQTWADCAKWKSLSDDEFASTFGKEVLKMYNLPTEAELQELERWENGDDDDSDEDEDEDEDEEEEPEDEEEEENEVALGMGAS